LRSAAKIVSVVIPTLNEEDGIRHTISSIPDSEIRELGYELEVLVVDGESSDCTRDVASRMGAKVLIERRKGYGLAYKNGLKAASGDVIITMDADGTYPAFLIPKCISILMQRGLDFITVNRLAKMEEGAMSLRLLVGNKILTSAMNLLYSVNIRDSQSGMWIMKKSFIDSISLHSNEMSFSEEIKIIAFKFFKALEVDGTYSKRIGQAKLEATKHGLNNLKHLFLYKKLLKQALLHTQQEIISTGINSKHLVSSNL
jgi:glycosyltransferase involved in cell wall biosynthesis